MLCCAKCISNVKICTIILVLYPQIDRKLHARFMHGQILQEVIFHLSKLLFHNFNVASGSCTVPPLLLWICVNWCKTVCTMLYLCNREYMFFPLRLQSEKTLEVKIAHLCKGISSQTHYIAWTKHDPSPCCGFNHLDSYILLLVVIVFSFHSLCTFAIE